MSVVATTPVAGVMRVERSELMDVIQEEGSVRYIRMTCDTGNKDLEKSYFDYLEEFAENV